MGILKKLVASLRWLAYLVFWIGLGAGTHVRLKHLSERRWLMSVALLTSSSVVLFPVLVLQLSNRSLRVITPLVLTFSPSFLLGVLAFSQTEQLHTDKYEIVMDLLVAASLGLYVFWAITDRSMTTVSPPVSIQSYELSALAGLSLSTLISGNPNTSGIVCSIAFIGLIIFSFYRRNLIPVILIPLYVVLNIKTILQGTEYMNRELFALFALLAIVESAVDVFASNYTSLSTWNPVFGLPLCVLRLVSVFVFCMEAALLILVGKSLSSHKEWWVVIPLFVGCSVVLWLPSHIIYFVVNWKLWSRVKKAVEIHNTDPTRKLPHIFSSRGLRHFALFTYPLMCGNAVITLMLFMWSWTTQTDETCGLLLLCLPTQIILISFLRDLSINLGGSCCGFSLVTPSVLRSEDVQNLRAVQTSSSYATRSLRLIQEFFNHHLIEDAGCEYYSERVTEGALRTNLNKFFAKRTKQGDGYDSYLLYYSGPVTESGDWVLKDGKTLTYKQLLSMWIDHESSRSSRLILVLDTAKSNYWVPLVRKTTTAYVGIQTLYVMRDCEAQQMFAVGDFTRDWVDYNCNPDSEVYSDSFRSPIISTYGVSPYWSFFRFHEPSVDEMDKHWQENFSIKIRPLIQLCSLCDHKRVCCLCRCCSRTITFLRLGAWPPNQLDIGHGFKLLRYFKIPSSSSGIL